MNECFDHKFFLERVEIIPHVEQWKYFVCQVCEKTEVQVIKLGRIVELATEEKI